MKELPPAEIIAWLRSKEGERWSMQYLFRVNRFYGTARSGVFGSLLNLNELASPDHWYTPVNESICHQMCDDDWLYEPEKLPQGLSSPA